MKVIVNLIFLFYTANLFSINLYFNGDTLFVWSRTGLVLRETGSFDGKKLQTIPFGKSVITKEAKYYRSEVEINSNLINSYNKFDKSLNKEITVPSVVIKGNWVKVIWENQEGYVFDGYLSKFPPLFDFQVEYSDFIDQYLSNIFKVLQKTEKGCDDALERSIEFGAGVSYQSIGVDGGVETNYFIPNLSYEEALILLYYSNFISENIEYETNAATSCKNINSRSIEFKYYGALKQINVIEIGQLTIIKFRSAC